MQFTWKKNESVDPLKLTFIAKRHLCAESTRATSRMMVLACIVAFPKRKKDHVTRHLKVSKALLL